MAFTVTLTAVKLRLRLTRLLQKESVPEVGELLEWVSDQVSQWQVDSPAGGVVAWSQYYANHLATLQATIVVITDRMGAMADIEIEDVTTHPTGDSFQSRKKNVTRGLEKALAEAKKERDRILGQLGVPTADGPYPALMQTTRRAEEYTVGSYSTADPGTDWTKRNADSPYFDERKSATGVTRKDN